MLHLAEATTPFDTAAVATTPAHGDRQFGFDSRLSRAIDRDHPFVYHDADLLAVITAFQGRPGMRLLPVVGRTDRPLGVIYEADVRKLLFNPFGHDLLANPGITSNIADYLRDCPVRAIDARIDTLISEFRTDSYFEGLIVTEQNRYVGVLSNRALLRVAAEQESERSERRGERLAAIESSAAAFRSHATRASTELAATARELAALATEFLTTARANEQRGADMTDATHSASVGLESIATQVSALAGAGEQVRVQTSATHNAAAVALELSATNSDRAGALARTTDEIGDVVSLIQRISKQVQLLSLNARIEATRAGAAGAAFGIVADEIRQLADQTQSAAGTIHDRTRAVRNAVEEALSSHSALRSAIVTVAEATAEIEQAMTEHARSTHIIADHIRSADERGRDIEHGVRAIRDDAGILITRTGRVEAMASAISANAAAMHHRVDQFLTELASA